MLLDKLMLKYAILVCIYLNIFLNIRTCLNSTCVQQNILHNFPESKISTKKENVTITTTKMEQNNYFQHFHSFLSSDDYGDVGQ